MKNDTSSQIFLFSTSPKIYFPSTESQTIKTPPKMTLKDPPPLYSPPKLEIMSPSKRNSSFSKFTSRFSFKKKPQSPTYNLNDIEAKKLREKLSNVNGGKLSSNAAKKRSSTKTISKTSSKKTKDFYTPNYLWIVFYVKKFISILRVNVLLKKLGKMKSYHYSMIGDKTYYNTDIGLLLNLMRENNPLYQSEMLKKTRMEVFVERIQKIINFIMVLFNKVEVFQPDKWIISTWNFIMLFFVLINALYIPLKIGFEIDEDKVNRYIYVIFEQIPVWIFIVDILVSINTAYYSKGVFLIDRIKIIKHYIKSYLLLDLVTIGPFLLGYFSSISYVEMLFLLRILKLNASIKKLEEFLQLRDLYGGKFQLVKLMGLIFYMAHISCCAWHYLASVEISKGVTDTWLDSLRIRNAEWEVKYVNSLYYSIVTMVTVGYGDITPQNSVEKVFSICYIGMACGIFAYGVNEVGSILRDMYKSENDFKVQFLSMNAYMKSRGLNKALQLRVQKYLEYMHEENKFGYKNGDLLLTSLSSKLKQEVLMDIYGKILRDYSVFSANFSSNFLKKLALKMREMTFAPDDIIIEENEKDDKSLYFILKGEVELFQTMRNDNLQKQLTYKSLKKGEHFGSYSFFTEEMRQLSVKSVNITHIACLSKHDFLEIIKDFPEDFEKYHMLVDSIKVYSKYCELTTKCSSCGSLDHPPNRCDLINYRPLHQKIIRIFQENSNQKRMNYSRVFKKSFGNLKDQYQIETAVSKFKRLKTDLIEEYTFKYLALESEFESSSNNDSLLMDFDEEKKDLWAEPPSIFVKKPSDDLDRIKRDDNMKKSIKQRKVSADGIFFTQQMNIIPQSNDKVQEITNRKYTTESSNINTPESSPKNKRISESPKIKKTKTLFLEPQEAELPLRPDVQNNLICNQTPFFNILKRRKSMMSLSQYNLDIQEENMLEDIDIKQEFDKLKNYKFYFPHNNSDIILENIQNQALAEKKRELTVFSSKRKKNKGNIRFDPTKLARIIPIKEKTFLGNFLRKKTKVPTFNNLLKNFTINTVTEMRKNKD